MTVEQGIEAATARPINVLVADESDSLRALVRITLTSQGWSVIEASTGLDAALKEQRALEERGMRKRLGEVLREDGAVSAPAIDRALLEQMHARAVGAERGRACVLIVDDHLAVREGLKSLIREDDTLEVVGEAGDAGQGPRPGRRAPPDLRLRANRQPGRRGLPL